jgi:hypothetical protein
LTIMVSTDAQTMHYVLSAADSSANQVKLPVVDLLVTDNIPPIILDLTFGAPTTGENFSFFARITDNIGIDEANVLYRFDDGQSENVTMTDGPTYTLDLYIPINVRSLHYVLSANDSSGHWASIPEVNLSVKDDDLPSVEDQTGTPYSGEPFILRCRSFDNIGILQVESEYWFDGGTHIRERMDTKEDYQTLLNVPKEARVLHYKLTAKDTSGNLNSTSANLMIIDKIAPVLLDRCKDPTTGENFSFDFTATENWIIKNFTLEYWFDNATHTNLRYTGVVTVRVPSNSTVLHYVVTVLDDSNNTARLGIERAVRDNIAPRIIDNSGNCTTGDDFRFAVEIVENVGIAEAYLDFRFDDGGWTRILLNRSTLIITPDSAHYLDYTIFVNDTSGNSVKTFGHKEVLDNDAPISENPTWTYGLEGMLIRVQVTDNIGVNDVHIRYSYDNASSIEIMMMPDGTTYYVLINISDAEALRYRISSKDATGNIIEVDGFVDVKSLLSVEIRDKSKNPTTGEEFTIDLNISNPKYNSELRIDYWFDNSNITTIPYTPGVSIAIPDHASKLHYKITTTDICGIRRNATFTKDISDNDAPVLEVQEYGTRMAGSNLTLNISASDNMAIINATIRYWFDAGLNETVLNLGPEIHNYSLEIQLPKKIATMHYSIIVMDSSGNSKEVHDDLPIITKSNAPRSDNGPGLPGLLILLLIAGLVGLTLSGFLYLRRKRRKTS